jgi:hypothetical protein
MLDCKIIYMYIYILLKITELTRHCVCICCTLLYTCVRVNWCINLVVETAECLDPRSVTTSCPTRTESSC